MSFTKKEKEILATVNGLMTQLNIINVSITRKTVLRDKYQGLTDSYNKQLAEARKQADEIEKTLTALRDNLLNAMNSLDVPTPPTHIVARPIVENIGREE